MALDEDQIEFIEDLKRRLGIDERLGQQTSEMSQNMGKPARVPPITVEEGISISKEVLNPTIRRIIEELERER